VNSTTPKSNKEQANIVVNIVVTGSLSSKSQPSPRNGVSLAQPLEKPHPTFDYSSLIKTSGVNKSNLELYDDLGSKIWSHYTKLFYLDLVSKECEASTTSLNNSLTLLSANEPASKDKKSTKRPESSDEEFTEFTEITEFILPGKHKTDLLSSNQLNNKANQPSCVKSDTVSLTTDKVLAELAEHVNLATTVINETRQKNAEIAEITEKVQLANIVISESKQKISELSEKVDLAVCVISETKQKNAEIAEKYQLATNAITETKQKNAEISEKVQMATNIISETKQKNTEIAEKIQLATNAINETKQKTSEIEEKVQHATSVISKSKQKISELDEKIQSATNIINESKKKIAEFVEHPTSPTLQLALSNAEKILDLLQKTVYVANVLINELKEVVPKKTK